MARGRALPTGWIAKYGSLPIVLIGMASLALGISIGPRPTGDPVVAKASIERWQPTLETRAEPTPAMQLASADRVARSFDDLKQPASKGSIEPTPAMQQLASLHPEGLPLVGSEQLASKDYFEPASKGYIMYANSPTHWTAVPLPDEIGAARSEHNNNIRAEIEQASMLFDLDMRMMKAFARIESGFNPRATTGRYKCLFQLSDWEFRKYWQGDIYDIRNCSIAAARKLATEAAQFEHDVGRKVSAIELYMIHQQGYQGAAFHYDAPHQLAWKNMFLTNEGQEKGEAWARKAIWGNVPSDIKDKIKGGLEALTSGEFIALWAERVERFIARKIEPPTFFVQRVAKEKKSSKLAAAGKKKKPTKVAAASKKKKKIKVASR
jgi:hypothetical protein